MTDLTLAQFDYQLPEELIAQFPLKERSDSRLMVLERASGQISHYQVKDLPQFVNPGDLMVFNNSRVMAARLYGQKPTGAKIEFLVERVLNEKTFLSHVRANKTLKIGQKIHFENGAVCEIVAREHDLFKCEIISATSILKLMDEIGHIPLPPYMTREDSEFDKERYQTVYAKDLGSAAAPTAGLHFTETLLEELHTKGVKNTFVTLHVGAGTFQPVRSERIKDHVMHEEWLTVSKDVVEQVAQAKCAHKRIIAVGTTSVRSLETAALSGQLKPYTGESDLFLYPGKRFNVVDSLFTNFHLPKSTLLMLVCAFAGTELMLKAYETAVKERYRFFSYGDAMLIL